MRRMLVVYAVGSARKNNADRRKFPDLFDRHGTGLQFAVHAEIAHATGNKLVVLSSEVENEHFFVIHSILRNQL